MRRKELRKLKEKRRKKRDWKGKESVNKRKKKDWQKKKEREKLKNRNKNWKRKRSVKRRKKRSESSVSNLTSSLTRRCVTRSNSSY